VVESNPKKGPDSQEFRPPSTREMRAWLEASGVRPTKTLGQNFLSDPNLARAILNDSGVGPGERVMEVGIGCGFLTEPLAQLGVELLAVEIDERLLAITQQRMGQYPGVRFVHADVLGGKRRLAEEVLQVLWKSEPWHLVANLPYKIAGPLAAVLSVHSNPPQSMSILVQAEVAERLAAKPGTPAWGGLSARIQLRYRARLGREVGAQLFWPRPKVRSRIAHLELRSDLAASPRQQGIFDQLVQGLFQRRRKAISTGLKALLMPGADIQALLESVDLDPKLRPEALEISQWSALAGAVELLEPEFLARHKESL